MTYGIATLISCILFPLFAWFGLWVSKRTLYRPVDATESVQRDEEGERKRVREVKEKQVRATFMTYGVIVLVLFVLAALTEPARKVHAALWPTVTPTASNTPTPTPTRKPTNTPTITFTPSATGTQSAQNFLTSLAVTGTPGTATPFLPSSGGVIVQTRVVSVPQTVVVVRTVIVQQTVIVPQTVVVTVTNTPLHTSTATVSPTPTMNYTETAAPSPSATPTFTETPTGTP